MHKRNSQEMSVKDFLREVVFCEKENLQVNPQRNGNGVLSTGGQDKAKVASYQPQTNHTPTSRNNIQGTGFPQVFGTACKHDSQGKLVQKQETLQSRHEHRQENWEYQFAPKGHLQKVFCNGQVQEEYLYNAQGQRICDKLAHLGQVRNFAYNRLGQLHTVDGVTYAYDEAGALSAKTLQGKTTRYFYGDNTLLDRAILPNGLEVRYEYQGGLLPHKIYLDGRLAEVYHWENILQLRSFEDIFAQTSYTFHYENTGNAHSEKRRSPHLMTITGSLATALNMGDSAKAEIYELFAVAEGQAGSQQNAHPQNTIHLRIGIDQLGSIRTLSDKSGNLLKQIAFDSFGNTVSETSPEIALPIGFAGGFVDRHTGFVRFGFRDYDPQVGRFTAKDPIGDTGGDHDLYDYCVDDPVSFVDNTGLFRKFLVRALGAKIAGGGLVGKMIFPDHLNEPEVVIELAREATKINNKIRVGTATSQDFKRLQEIKERDTALRQKYGDIYENSSFYSAYPPIN